MNKTTSEMLARLAALLAKHQTQWKPDSDILAIQTRADADALRRISMTLDRWHALECGDGNDYGSWAIVRGRMRTFVPEEGKRIKQFEHDDDGKPYLEHHHYLHGKGKDYVTYTPMPDRERGALKRMAAIMARYPSLQYYVQGDPRGAALYIIRPGDVPAGASLDSCYSNGVAVFK
jgi:hypothetical protein